MFNGFSYSVKGVSHERKGIVCQDASSHRVAERYAVCVVADGHGSKKHFRSNFSFFIKIPRRFNGEYTVCINFQAGNTPGKAYSKTAH